MKSALSMVLMLILTAQCGCKKERAISPHQRIITKPVQRDFGLAGQWKSQDENIPFVNGDLTISVDNEGVYHVSSPSLDDLNVSLRATPLDDDSGYAIVDIEAELPDESVARYLALAKRKDNILYVWWIIDKNLAGMMQTDGHNAVIERNAIVTTVRAEAECLLDCIRNHPSDLVGKQCTYELVPVTSNIKDRAVMQERLWRSTPVGTSRATARAFMEREGFKCKVKQNSSFQGREGIDYLYCDRTERYARWVDQRWQIALLLEGDRVTEIVVSHGLIGP